jgi:hypothetical protein
MRVEGFLETVAMSSMGGAMRCAVGTIVLMGLLATACGSANVAQRPPPDLPVPASEPRERVAARVDMVPSRDCEEAFDLALYANRAIELIAWDSRVGTCADRHVSIQFFPRKISRSQVVDAVNQRATRVTVYREGAFNHDAKR